jgi:hypothetical protein
VSGTAPDVSGVVTPHPSGQQGRLITPHGVQLPVRTFERGDEVVLVVMSEFDTDLFNGLLEPSMLEYASTRGVVRMRGEAVFEQHSVVRFHILGDTEVIQRREFVRVHTPQQVLLGDNQPVDEVREAHTIDLSGGGMLVSGAKHLQIGDTVRFRMRLGDDPATISGTARVVRARKDGKRALSFEEIDEGDRQRLIRFVFQILRTAAAKTRGDYV